MMQIKRTKPLQWIWINMCKPLRQFSEKGASPFTFSCKRHAYCLVRRTCTRTQRHTGFVPVQSHQLGGHLDARPHGHQRGLSSLFNVNLNMIRNDLNVQYYACTTVMLYIHILIMDVWEGEPNCNACKQVNRSIATVPKPGVRLHQGGNLTRAQKGLTGVKQDID